MPIVHKIHIEEKRKTDIVVLHLSSNTKQSLKCKNTCNLTTVLHKSIISYKIK